MGLIPLAFSNRTLRARAEALRPRLYRMAYAWSHDATLSEDLAQEALTRGLERIAQLRDPEKLEPWLFRILSNCWHDALRMRIDAEDVDEIAGELACLAPGPEQLHAASQLVRRVRAAVARLPLGQREAVTLVDLGEFSYADAAEILDIPVGTVMSRLCRARQALREMLAGGTATVVPIEKAAWKRR